MLGTWQMKWYLCCKAVRFAENRDRVIAWTKRGSSNFTGVSYCADQRFENKKTLMNPTTGFWFGRVDKSKLSLCMWTFCEWKPMAAEVNPLKARSEKNKCFFIFKHSLNEFLHLVSTIQQHNLFKFNVLLQRHFAGFQNNFTLTWISYILDKNTIKSMLVPLTICIQ